MENPFSIGDYVDCKQIHADWFVGRIIEKEDDFVTIRLDGMAPNNDITVKFNSPRIAPFRRHTQGYTGYKKTIRDDPKLELDKLEEVSNLIEVFIQKNPSQFEAKKINEALRGRIFLFTDALLTKPYNKYRVDDINSYLKYLCKYLGFGVYYLGKYQKSFAYFNEGRQNPITLVTKPDVAYSHFILELFFSLDAIFGEMKRCLRLYEFINSEGNTDLNLEAINIKVKEGGITTGIFQTDNSSTKSEEAIEEENPQQTSTSEPHVGKTILDLENCMIEKFAQIGGFRTLLNLIYIDNGEEKGTDASTTTKGGFFANNGENKYGCPLAIVAKVIELMGDASKRMNEQAKLTYIMDLKQRVFQRIRTISDTEIKELELESLHAIFDTMESVLGTFENEKIMDEFDEFRETNELSIYLRLMDSSSFEKKLKGINEIREFVSRIEYAYQEDEDPQANKKPVRFMKAERFIEWVLENKLIDLIYEKYGHIELIKKSMKIQKFIAEFSERFPQSLIDLIWNSFHDKHEEVIKTIYENIIELAPYLNLEAAQRMYSKFLTIKYENYDEDFVDLLGRFTQKCLRLVVMKTKDGEMKVNQASMEGEYQYFGVRLMFNLILDETPINEALSYRVLVYLQEIISEFPAAEIFIEIVNQCLENLEKDVSIYQSLLIMKEYLMTMQIVPNYQDFCQQYFKDFEEKNQITNYLVRNIESYWHKVQQRIQARKYALKTNSEANQHESFVGKFSHEKNIFERLDTLRYFTAHPYLTANLSTDQVKQLWRIFVQEANFSFETSMFLQFFSQIYTIPQKGLALLVSLDNIKEVLLEILCNKEFLDIKDFTPEKFNCLEFYFLCANMKEEKISFNAYEEAKNPQISSMNSITKDKDLIGLSYLWECLIECNDKDIVEKFITLLVNIYTRLSPELKTEEFEVYKELINGVMNSIEKVLVVKNVPAIERYILFLDKFFEKFDNKKGLIYYKTHRLQNTMTPSLKIRGSVRLLPYSFSKNYEFYLRDRVGYIKEVLASEFEIDSNDFNLHISGRLVTDQDMFKEYQAFYSNNDPSMIMVKKKDLEKHATVRHLLSKNPQHIEVIFRIFSTINPEELKTVWNFVQKLSVQDDIKKAFEEKTDYLETLGGDDQLSDTNIYIVHYYLSIVKELSLDDEYYWKLKMSDHKQHKSEWATHFINNKGVEWLMSLILKTDFAHISNFLFIKTLLLLSKLLYFYFSLDENLLVNDKFFSKILDVIMYSSKYIGSLPKSSLMAESECIKDQYTLVIYWSSILRKSLQINPTLHTTFLTYPNLRELFIQVYIKSVHEESSQFDGQEAFNLLLFSVFDKLRASEDKQLGTDMFKFIFEELIFLALRTPEPAFIILRWIGDFFDKFDLKEDLGCDINVFNIIIQLVDFIKNCERSLKHTQSIKIEACFFILDRYLLNNRSKETFDFFGQDQGLIAEILNEGIFKVPSYDGQDGPKYQSKELKATAFSTLALLGETQRNFNTITSILLPIHQAGVWRSAKETSWNLTANIKRRSHKYAGLVNLGCTCYMNSTLQQLFAIPTFQKYLLQLEDPSFKKEEIEDNLLFQLKRLFYGMVHVDQEHFSPKRFCLAFKDLDGNPTSFLEQKDAFEFLSLNIDRIEEQLKGTKHANFIKAHFGGLLCNELICKGCPHYYEREEPFLSLNLIVRNKKNIKESLESFVEGEIMDGDNAYYCEQCQMKVKTVKRVSIKKLPSYLLIGLKRFDYNFDMGIRIKMNDYCEFPFELNMLPYTQQYLNKMERPRKNTGDATHSQMYSNSKSMNGSQASGEYTLKGVVIHMGTADSGHYYSIIKDKEVDANGKTNNVWLEFNDSKVSDFNIRDLPNIAFGEREGCPSFQSAYVLVYEKKELNEDLKQLENLFVNTNENSNGNSNDQTTQASNNGSMEIETKIPQHIKEEQICLKEVEEEIKRKNLKIFYQSNIFANFYTKFIMDLINNYRNNLAQIKEMNIEKGSATEMEEEGKDFSKKASSKNLFIFLWTVYTSTIVRLGEKKLQKTFFEVIYDMLSKDVNNNFILLHYFANTNFFTEHILQCPHKDFRRFSINLIKKAFRVVYVTEKKNEAALEVDEEELPCATGSNFLSVAMCHLDDAKSYNRNLEEYFSMFLLLMKIDLEVVKYLLSRQFLKRLGFYFFNKNLLDEEIRGLNIEEPLYYESEIPIEFNEKVLNNPRKGKEKDFYKPSITDLTSFFNLVWELLRHTTDPDRPNHETYSFHKRGADYKLDEVESRIFALNQGQIERMFSAITINNQKARKIICKIVEFASFESTENSRACLSYISEGLGEENSEDIYEEYFTLINGLAKMQDSIQTNRNAIMIETFINSLSKFPGPVLKRCCEFLRKLIKNNCEIHDLMTKNENLPNKVIKALRTYCMRSSTSYASDYLSKPSNFQVVQKLKSSLQDEIVYFQKVKENEIEDARDGLFSESDDSLPMNFKREKAVEFYDRTTKKWIKGVVDNVYENMVKVRVVGNTNAQYFEWFDDDFPYIRSEAEEPEDQEEEAEVKEEEEEEEMIHEDRSPEVEVEDDSNTNDCTTNELSLQPNTSPSVNSIDENYEE